MLIDLQWAYLEVSFSDGGGGRVETENSKQWFTFLPTIQQNGNYGFF